MNTERFFESFFNNVELNSLLIMERDGTVLRVNRAFTKNYGYTNEEIAGKNFRMLFNEKDKEAGLPELELKTVMETRQSHDENYVMDKNGFGIWSIGESVLVEGREGQQYILKDIINLQSKRQIQLFLSETEELLEKIFDSSREIPMMVLDGSMKVQKVNAPFVELFQLPAPPPAGSRLTDIEHPFWKVSSIRNELASIFVANQAIKNKKYLVADNGVEKTVLLNTKIIEGGVTAGRRIFIIMNEVSGEME